MTSCGSAYGGGGYRSTTGTFGGCCSSSYGDYSHHISSHYLLMICEIFLREFSELRLDNFYCRALWTLRILRTAFMTFYFKALLHLIFGIYFSIYIYPAFTGNKHTRNQKLYPTCTVFFYLCSLWTCSSLICLIWIMQAGL